MAWSTQVSPTIVFQKNTAEARAACWAYEAHTDSWQTEPSVASVDADCSNMPLAAVGERLRRSETNGTNQSRDLTYLHEIVLNES